MHFHYIKLLILLIFRRISKITSRLSHINFGNIGGGNLLKKAFFIMLLVI